MNKDTTDMKAKYEWAHDQRILLCEEELSELYRIAPLGEKPPESLETVFSNSMFKCFVYDQDLLIGAGRALAGGLDCAHLADVAVHPNYQGQGLGKAIILELVGLCSGHKKIILYAKPGTEGFYLKLGSLPMATAMAIWHHREAAVGNGPLIAESPDPSRRSDELEVRT